MPARRLLPALGIILLSCAAPLLAQSRTGAPTIADTAALQRLLVAEDARGTGLDGTAPLTDALHGSDTLLRRLAVRGLGRLERPEVGRSLLAALDDPVPAIRAEAANAIAQSLRRVRRADPPPTDGAPLGTREAAAALARALGTERDPRVVDALGQSLGRLPLPDSAAARGAEAVIRAGFASARSAGLAHGLYTIARARRATGTLDDSSLSLLRSAALQSRDTMLCRLALLTLAAAGGLDSAIAVRAIRDADAESRRMALRGAGALSAPLRATLVARALADPSRIVRAEAAAAARVGDGRPNCRPLLRLAADRDGYVALVAVDSLGGGCADTAGAVAALKRLTRMPSRGGPPDHRWQVGAHALVTLARLDPAGAARLLPEFAGANRPELRAYGARAAAITGNAPLLYRLARDADRNVQEAAIAGLSATVGHQADSVYIAALGSSGHQVAREAAEALDSTTNPAALGALLAAFDRLSATRSENTRDPRLAMLARIAALGSTTTAPRLERYLADYDTAVAALSAETLTRWTGRTPRPEAVPLPIHPEPLAAVFLDDGVRLRVTMAPSSGGGTFTIRLFPRDAPATVARVLRLVRAGWYDGKVFQRVEPNFVIQGGGPDANEYVGDDAFMRDELTMRTHARGTLGISSRGRDTGDGQWFINLVDNPLLDHEFTVFGRIDGGADAAEHILEGDRIARVVVLTR